MLGLIYFSISISRFSHKILYYLKIEGYSPKEFIKFWNFIDVYQTQNNKIFNLIQEFYTLFWIQICYSSIFYLIAYMHSAVFHHQQFAILSSIIIIIVMRTFDIAPQKCKASSEGLAMRISKALTISSSIEGTVKYNQTHLVTTSLRMSTRVEKY